MNSKNQCLLILGESKIGKSTILKKIINNLRSREYSVGGFITKLHIYLIKIELLSHIRTPQKVLD